MASSSTIFQKLPSCSFYQSNSCRNHIFALNPSDVLSSKALLSFGRQRLCTTIRIKLVNNPKVVKPIVYAAQSNFIRVLQTAWKVGKDGVNAGTSLVPDSVPRPIARIFVTVVAGFLALFVLKSFLSTAFFILAVMGLSYFAFIALNKDEGPKPKMNEGNSSVDVDDSLEEARRIMEKYK